MPEGRLVARMGRPPGAAERGDCPVCGWDVPLRKDGVVMWHHDSRTGKPCRAWTESMRAEATSARPAE